MPKCADDASAGATTRLLRVRRVSPAAPAVALEGVTCRHRGTVAVDDVTLSIAPGSFVAIVGPSGSGKTTLLRLVNRLGEPNEGRILVAGEDVRTQDPIGLRRRIGYVFQGIGLFPHMTVAENIAITPRLLGWERAAREARVDELLDLVRLDRARYRGRMPHELSGGERQRVGVARALAAKPGLVLMDEPFGALDPLTREALGDDYRALHASLGLTTVLITHDMLEAVFLADRIAVMQAGRIVADAEPRALLRREDDDFAATLMRTPRRAAARLDALMNGSAAA